MIKKQHDFHYPDKNNGSDIQKAAKKQEEKIDALIAQFEEAGRYTAIPAVTPEQMRETEKVLDFSFPEDYIKVLTSGSFYKANIHFMKPEVSELNNDLIVFAHWNDTQFGFHRKDKNAMGEPAIYVTVGEFTEKRFDNFCQWFGMVYDTATQPFTSE